MALDELELDNNLGNVRDIDAIDQLVKVDGLHIIDVGCFNGGLAKALAKRGATVLGLEPDPTQAKLNKTAELPDGVTLVEGRGEAIPSDDNSADGVFFSKSLHHLPAEGMDKALEEAARVLRRDGFLYVMEPDIRGEFSQMAKPVHDETIVRAQALVALARTADTLFGEVEEFWYTITNTFPDFDAFKQRMLGNTFNKHQEEAFKSAELHDNFEKGRDGGEFRFTNLMRVRLYRNPK